MKLKAILVICVFLYLGAHIKTPQPYRPYDIPTQATQVSVAAIRPECVERQDICDSLLKAGFNENQLNVMMAISRAESGWRIEIEGDQSLKTRKWGVSVGVLQVRTINPGYPQGCRIYEQLKDNLDMQTSCAHQIYLKQGYRAWSVFKNETYKPFLK